MGNSFPGIVLFSDSSVNKEKYIYILKTLIAPFAYTCDIEQVHKENSFYLELEESDLNIFRSKKCKHSTFQRTLKSMGYLKVLEELNNYQQAIRDFQTFYQLKVTGIKITSEHSQCVQFIIYFF